LSYDKCFHFFHYSFHYAENYGYTEPALSLPQHNIHGVIVKAVFLVPTCNSEYNMDENLGELPNGLPIPENDGACDHILGKMIPTITLPSTKGGSLDVCNVDSRFVVLYFFPMMGILGKSLPVGWDNIPGARGCTPQNITINEHVDDLLKYSATPIGISTQPIVELSKLSESREFSQTLLSDVNLKFNEKLDIPTFQVENKTMYKRLTLILNESKIIKVFSPIFPPDKHVFEILEWLKNS